MQLDVPNLPDVVGVRFAYIPDYPGYCINDHGDVYSCKNARWGYRNKWEPLKEGTSSSGYPTVNLTRKGFPPRTRPTCVLVMLSFAGPRPLKMDCCHENGVRTDSRLCNLRWDTRKGNVSDTDRHGTKIQGERSPNRCERIESGEEFPTEDDMVEWAEHYFVCCWMSRSGAAGTSREFKASFVERWDAGGGDSALRFRSATEALRDWRRATARATFTCKDAFEMIARTKDKRRHGLYGDSPFPGAGRRYRHNAGKTDAEERKWHTRLRDGVQRFEQTRVVMRFYDHPLIRELYDPSRWDWKFLDGGKTQANETAPEVLLINRTEAK